MKKILILFLLVVFSVSGCVSYEHYYKLDDQYLARRQLETRSYETKDEEALLIASAQVLQDLGFTLDESEIKLGLITANKDNFKQLCYKIEMFEEYNLKNKSTTNIFCE